MGIGIEDNNICLRTLVRIMRHNLSVISSSAGCGVIISYDGRTREQSQNERLVKLKAQAPHVTMS